MPNTILSTTCYMLIICNTLPITQLLYFLFYNLLADCKTSKIKLHYTIKIFKDLKQTKTKFTTDTSNVVKISAACLNNDEIDEGGFAIHLSTCNQPLFLRTNTHEYGWQLYW